MKNISVQSFKEVVEAEKNNASIDFINVCTPAEYDEKHIEGVRNVPLSDIQAHCDEFAGKKTIYVHCRSGNRSLKAIHALESLGVKAELVNVVGGISAWSMAGLPTNSFTTRMPIMQQVLLAAGVLSMTGLILSIFNPIYLVIPAFVGTGQLFAGMTGWCGMSILLSKMPWNRS